MCYYITGLILVLVLPLSGGSKDKLRLIQAGKGQQYPDKGTVVKKLSRDVIFQKGDIEMQCQLAYWYEDERRIDLHDKVVVIKDTIRVETSKMSFFEDQDLLVSYKRTKVQNGSVTLEGDTAYYYTETDLFEVKSNVIFSEDDQELKTDFLRYFADIKETRALENSEFIDKLEHTTLYSDSILYYHENKNFIASINPVLVQIDSAGKESYRVTGDVIQGDQGTGQFSALGNVKLSREDFTSLSETVDYVDSLEQMVLQGRPVVFSENQKITGDIIQVNLKNNKIDWVFIDRNARAESDGLAFLQSLKSDSLASERGDSLNVRDELAGKQMLVFFKDGDIDSIRVSGMATSFYNVTEDSIIQGQNVTSGDTVIMHMSDNKLEKIIVIGGTRGEYKPHPTNKDMDTTVVYSSEYINYNIEDKSTILNHQAAVHYGDTELTAGKIVVAWSENLLYAYPEDSTETDTVLQGIPTLLQRGDEPFSGNEMVYNIRTKRGRIVEGATKIADGYYYGDNISKSDNKVFYVEDGKYTTCDVPDCPHYYFKSKQMKLIHKDKFIARPIVLYIHDIPLIGLPFGVFPSKSGRRHNGWIMPSYGQSGKSGNYINGLGYFWAPNDYYDLRLTGSFYDKRGLKGNLRTRYVKRYVFSGNIQGSYENTFLKVSPEKIWTLNVTHNHTISPTMKLAVNGKFSSRDDYNRTYGLTEEIRLQQQLISNATLRKSWPGTPYSFSANLNQTTNLQATTTIEDAPESAGLTTSYITRTLPNISFSRSSKALIPVKSSQSASDAKWYNNIYWNYSSKFLNKERIYYESIDTTTWEEQQVKMNGLTHSISLNGTQKLLKYISLSEGVSISGGGILEYDKPVVDENGYFVTDEDGALVTETVSALRTRHTGSASMSAQTKIYGLFPVKIGPLKAIRHVITPRVGLSYRPDFHNEIMGWDPGFIMTGVDTNGNEWEYDPFSSTVLGSTPSGESRSMNISLGNVFQAKVRDGDKDRIISNLLSANLSTSHNFAADSLNWSTIRSSVRAQLSQKLALNFSATHDLYAYENGRKINQFNVNEKGILMPRLTAMSVSSGFKLTGSSFGNKKQKHGDKPELADADTTVTDNLMNPDFGSDIEETGGKSEKNKKSGRQIWDASFSFRYSLSQSNPSVKTESFSMNMGVNLKLTDKWKIKYSATVDMLDGSIKSQRFNIVRDLHCWEMIFSWVPSGYGKSYTLLINVKSPTLKDLKYEEKGGRSRNYGF